MLLNIIRDHVGDADVRNAVKTLQEKTHGSEDELALFLMKLSLYEKEKRIGTIGLDVYTRELAHLCSSILELTRHIIDEGRFQEQLSMVAEPSAPYMVRLEQKWSNFFQQMNWEYLAQPRLQNSSRPDFILKGKQNTNIEVEIVSIDKIENLINKSRYIRPELKNISLSNCLIFGNGPQITQNDFYPDTKAVQLGWIFNFDGNLWDKVVLKWGYDISNCSGYIYDMLSDKTSHKDFVDEGTYPKIKRIWENC